MTLQLTEFSLQSVSSQLATVTVLVAKGNKVNDSIVISDSERDYAMLTVCQSVCRITEAVVDRFLNGYILRQ